MAEQAFTKPVQASVARVSDEVAVGEDQEFQRKWWRFEKAIWIFFVILLLCDLAGLFGRGFLAKAHSVAADHSIDLRYERIERTGTPSTMVVHLAPGISHNGTVHLFVSQSMIDQLGTERVIPSPESTEIGSQGLTYTFAAASNPGIVEFSMRPPGPGRFPFTIGVPGSTFIEHSIVVMP